MFSSSVKPLENAITVPPPCTLEYCANARILHDVNIILLKVLSLAAQSSKGGARRMINCLLNR